MANESKNNFTDEEIEEQEGVEENSDKSEERDSQQSSSSKSSGDDGKHGKTFTQDQVSRMMTREKNQGRNAVYKELGIDPKDTKMVNMFKAFVASQKSDEQKAEEQEAESQSKVAEAERRAQIAEAKAEAMMLGVKPQYADDAVTLVLSKTSDDVDVKTVLSELKTKYPVWFGVASENSEDDKDGKKKVGQKGTGASVKSENKNRSSDGTKGIGARLAAQRKSGTKKSSYWGNN